ncbi:flavin-dependent oxidoreductase [Paenibacillus xylaniclasticus]|uniref:flavin-dependent oxidoreductase n=1 Tax=Paenibacillus xylaniclasticus TaxID=588083 RepID=UPI001C3F7270|nr:flavin-dependent oxidoreductase [Paenibacillus xylaniclasticus]
MNKSIKAIVVGAGIGGLTTALYLHRAGVEVQIYESVKTIKELGVGINLLPHSVRILWDLGLQEALDESAVRTKELAYHNKFGQLIWREDRGMDAGYNWPQYSIHRGRLQGILLHEVKRVLGEGCIHTGMHLSHVEQLNNKVQAYFIDRNNEHEQLELVESDFLIGADGIHSALRKQLYPQDDQPIYGGRILWRGMTKAKPFLSGRTMIMAGNIDEKFVAYPITTPDHSGYCDINWIAELSVAEAPNRNDWNRLANLADFAPKFQDWTFDWLDVPSLISGAEYVYEFPLVDKNPLPRWSFNRVTLLGDAAHPMYPIGSNGASQAILDAEALYLSLKENQNIEEALFAYEQRRIHKTASIVNSNRQHGPEIVMQMVHERAPEGFERLEDVISQAELEEVANRYKQIAGFDKEQLNRLEMKAIS